jgi:GNAT superfamily N-acetyltransferase
VSGANPLLRPAFLSDADAVAALFAEAGRSVGAREAAALIDDVTTRDDGWLLVGELEGSVCAVGSFRLSDDEDGTGVLGLLVVTERRRRLGVAGALTQALEDEARRRGCTRLVVGPDADLEGGRVFYVARGYADGPGGLSLAL